MLRALSAANPSVYMYGVDGFFDGPYVISYDPWAHAEQLGAEIVSNRTLPRDVVASYSHQLHLIFFRPDLPVDVERCAIAHELVHFEHRDIGKSQVEEDRADRISTLRLIRHSEVERLAAVTNDLAEMARELRVTEKTMRLYARMARNGTLPARQTRTESPA